MENTKAKLRDSIKERRRDNQSHFNLKLLTESSEFKDSQVIASYRSFGHEPDTTSLNELILKSGRQLLLPVRLSDNSLEFRIWDGNPSNLVRNGKLEEPSGERYLDPIDLMIVPALAVDKKGNRLGRGGGSYDRALDSFSGFSVALVYENEVLEELPTEEHDVPVRLLLTPEKLIRI